MPPRYITHVFSLCRSKPLALRTPVSKELCSHSVSVDDSRPPSFTLSSASPAGTSQSSHHMDLELPENPFTDPFAPQDLRGAGSFSDLDESSQQSLSAFFGDEPRQVGPASQPWRIPPALVRSRTLQLSHSQNEGSPLRWSYSNAAARAEERGLERSGSFLPTRRRLSVSSVSLDSLNTKPCVTPRRASLCAAAGSGDSPLSNANLRHLSSSQAARILKSDAGIVDPYVN
jgi:hypothetical protein